MFNRIFNVVIKNEQSQKHNFFITKHSTYLNNYNKIIIVSRVFSGKPTKNL